MLPNVSQSECEGQGDYRFDFTLHPPHPGRVAGANLTVYNDDLYGSHFLSVNDFVLVPVGVGHGHGQVDLTYTGATRFAVDMFEK